MAEVEATSQMPKPPNKRWIVFVVLFVAFMQLASTGGSYFVGFHEGGVAAQQALHAAAVAEQGRSKSLCDALKQLAETTAAVKLHPIFLQVYNDTGCVKISGPADHRVPGPVLSTGSGVTGNNNTKGTGQ